MVIVLFSNEKFYITIKQSGLFFIEMCSTRKIVNYFRPKKTQLTKNINFIYFQII